MSQGRLGWIEKEESLSPGRGVDYQENPNVLLAMAPAHRAHRVRVGALLTDSPSVELGRRGISPARSDLRRRCLGKAPRFERMAAAVVPVGHCSAMARPVRYQLRRPIREIVWFRE